MSKPIICSLQTLCLDFVVLETLFLVKKQTKNYMCEFSFLLVPVETEVNKDQTVVNSCPAVCVSRDNAH